LLNTHPAEVDESAARLWPTDHRWLVLLYLVFYGNVPPLGVPTDGTIIPTVRHQSHRRPARNMSIDGPPSVASTVRNLSHRLSSICRIDGPPSVASTVHHLSRRRSAICRIDCPQSDASTVRNLSHRRLL